VRRDLAHESAGAPGPEPAGLVSYATMKPTPESPAANTVERDPASPEVLRVLVDNHARFLGFLERRVGSRDVAEDILQEAFVRSLDRVDSIRTADSAVAWFYRVLRNAIADHFRRQEARDRALTQVSAEAGMEAAAVDEALEAVVCACVMKLLDTLKPEYATAVRRVDLDGMSVRGYAEESGITPGNAGVRLHRAREALRRQLARACGTCVDHGGFDCQCRG
jgi:RNA polymerase sigma factor (sigma-70 family)